MKERILYLDIAKFIGIFCIYFTFYILHLCRLTFWNYSKTCLFIIKISFHFLRKLLKYKALILITCICLFIFAQTVINPTPLISPHMIYNIDSACYYIIFYALGYCCFDYSNKLFICDRPYKKIITACAGTICLLYSALLFWGKNLLNYLNVIPNMNLVSSLLCPLMIIFLIFIVFKLLENVPLFLELGKNTLFLCGSEYIIKLVIPILLQTIGLNITLSNPIGTYFYTFICIMYICICILLYIYSSCNM